MTETFTARLKKIDPDGQVTIFELEVSAPGQDRRSTENLPEKLLTMGPWLEIVNSFKGLLE